MHEGLWARLDDMQPKAVAQRALCQYDSDRGCYCLEFINCQYTVDPGERAIYSVNDQEENIPAGFLEQLSILAYLINVSEKPVAGKHVSGDKLPGGQFFFRGPHGLPTVKLERAFGMDPELMVEKGQKLGASQLDFGDASIEIYILPKVPVYFIVWAGDNEFPAKASILFDATAADQLPLDALGAVVTLAVNALTKTAAS